MMCKLNHQAPKKTQCGYKNWAKYQQVVIKISHIAVLGGLLGTASVVTEANAQTTVTTNVARVNLAVNRQAEETYESLLSRAQSVAMSALKQRFHQDRHTPAVSVIIVGQHQGAIAPVLSIEVDRKQWQKAQTKDQIKFFATARQLLGFDDNGQAVVATPTPDTEENTELSNSNEAEMELENLDAESATDLNPEDESVQAPAIVPVDTPTPEIPGTVPIETSVPEVPGIAPTNDTSSVNSVPVPSAPASAPAAVDTNAIPSPLNPQIPTSPTPASPTPAIIPSTSGTTP